MVKDKCTLNLSFQDRSAYEMDLLSRLERVFPGVYESFTWEEAPEDRLQISEISALLYYELFTDMRTDLIESALLRKDNEIYSMTSQQFLDAAMRRELRDEALEPFIDQTYLHKLIFEYISQHHLFVQDGNELINCPVKEVW